MSNKTRVGPWTELWKIPRLMGYLCKDFPTGITQETSIAEKLKGKVVSTFYLLARYNRAKPYENHVKTIQFIRGYNLRTS